MLNQLTGKVDKSHDYKAIYLEGSNGEATY